MSAICDYCKQDMQTADGCILTEEDLNDRIMGKPVFYGQETHQGIVMQLGAEKAKEFLLQNPSPPRCGDCNTLLGMPHHPGCDQEECPKCHMQSLGCPCPEEVENRLLPASAVLNKLQEIPGLLEAGRKESAVVRELLKDLTDKELADMVRSAFRKAVPAVMLMSNDQKDYLGTFFAYSLYLAERVAEKAEPLH
jgi:hypothetical protein